MSTETFTLSETDQQVALQIARDSIRHGLETGRALTVNPVEFSKTLQQTLCCFVTLHKHGQLRGCIGALEAYQPLIEDIAEHAFAAAFRDPRFSPVDTTEFEQLDIEISVLGKAEAMSFNSEEDLLEQIRPGIDGLILEHGYNRGTFLPAVWQQLPEKTEFLNHLKIKAGLDKYWWHDDVKISRYQTFQFDE